MLVIFVGLFAASILPTISLLMTNLRSEGRSVQGLIALRDETLQSVNVLLFLFGCAAIAVASVFIVTAGVPRLLFSVPVIGDILRHRWGVILVPALGQGTTLFFVGLIVARAGLFPTAIRKTLGATADIAIEEARRRTIENAPAPGETAQSFKTREGFGRRHTLEEIATHQDPH